MLYYDKPFMDRKMLKVLIIEDTRLIRKFLTIILKSNNFEIVGAVETVDEGLKMYLEQKPDLVIMDMILPGKTGIEGISEIIQVDKDANILVCTALGQEQLRMEVLKAGAKDLIIKPFKEKKLIAKINGILEKSKEIEIKV